MDRERILPRDSIWFPSLREFAQSVPVPTAQIFRRSHLFRKIRIVSRDPHAFRRFREIERSSPRDVETCRDLLQDDGAEGISNLPGFRFRKHETSVLTPRTLVENSFEASSFFAY